MIALRILTVYLLWQFVNTQFPADYPDQVPGTCGSVSQFDCGNGKCIDVSKVRDCVADCPNGSDEKCGNGYVLCDQLAGGCSSTGCGKCAKSGSVSSQCFDQRYAKLCDTPTVYPFKCKSTVNCLSLNWLNDGTDDCGDGSDEDPCYTRTFLASLNRPVKCDPIATCNYTACPKSNLQCTCPPGYTGPITACQLLSPSPTTSQLLTTTTTRTTTTSLTSAPTTTAEPSTQTTAKTSTTTTTSNPTSAVITTVTTNVTATNFTSTTASATTSRTATTTTTTTLPCVANCKTSGACIIQSKILNSVNDCGDNSDEDVCYLGLSNCSSSMTCVPDIIHKSFTCTRLDYTEDCGDLLMRYKTNLTNGVYEVSTSKLCPKCTKKIYCDSVLNGGWTVIQRRQDGVENFNRSWSDYASGFGAVDKDFWIGNEYLANITGKDLLGYELLVQMVAASGALLFSRYDLFVVQPSYTNYQLHLGSMTSGNADDYLGPCRNRSFETYDRQTVNGTVNCAVYLQSGWWLSSSCSNASDMNVPYVPVAKSDLSGVQWSQNGVPMRLNIVEMKIRPLSLSQASANITTVTPPDLHSCGFMTMVNYCHLISAAVLLQLVQLWLSVY